MIDVISIRDFSRDDLDSLIDTALQMKAEGVTPSGAQKKVASLFFEDSTRTRTSFERAAKNLGYEVDGFAGPEGTSVKKGEPLADTVRMFEGYQCDAIVMRHGLEGAARFAADVLEAPVISGGDGSNQHPTQTMQDLMTIQEAHGKIDGLQVAMVGDLKYGRTVHSLLDALGKYDVGVRLVAPGLVAMPGWRVDDYKKAMGKDIQITPDFLAAIKEVDVLYMTRIQRERFPQGPEGQAEYETVSGVYKLYAELLREAKPGLIVLHPLPRYKHSLEIALDVDKTPNAKYIEQASNGLFMRQAILRRVLEEGGFEREPQKLGEHPSSWRELSIKDGTKKGEHLIYRLDNGTLIDHIEAGNSRRVLRVLGLKDYTETPLIVAQGLSSDRYGRKDVVGVQDKELTEYDLSKLALVTSQATVNIVREGRVIRKGKILLPPVIDGLVQCQNQKCVTHPSNYEHAPSRFYTESVEPLQLRCHYCEQPTTRENMRLLL